MSLMSQLANLLMSNPRRIRKDAPHTDASPRGDAPRPTFQVPSIRPGAAPAPAIKPHRDEDA